MYTKINKLPSEADVDKLAHVYRNGVQPDCKEEYRDIRVMEEHGCYANDFSDECTDPMNWGGKE